MAKKYRLNIALSMNNPLQYEAWLILSRTENKTYAICEAVCGYYKQRDLKETLRAVLQEELKNVTVPVTVEADTEEGTDAVVNDAVLDFLLSLQNG